MSGPDVTVAMEQDSRLAVVTIDRRAVLNALHPDTVDDLTATLLRLGGTNVRTVIVRGAGRAFGAGADVDAMHRMSAPEFREFVRGLQYLTSILRDATFVSIAAISGPAVGAASELACACDLRIAAGNATFSFPEAGIGLVVTGGTSFLLPRIVGTAWARRLVLTGETISASVAYRIGLVDEVVEPDRLIDAAMARAAVIAHTDPLASKLARRLLDRGMDGSLDTILHEELETISLCFEDGDARRRMRAFLDKEDPGAGNEEARLARDLAPGAETLRQVDVGDEPPALVFRTAN